MSEQAKFYTRGNTVTWTDKETGRVQIVQIESELNGVRLVERKHDIAVFIEDSDREGKFLWTEIATIYKPEDEIFRREAKVNWCALGSQSPEVTLRFARAIETAAFLASVINSQCTTEEAE